LRGQVEHTDVVGFEVRHGWSCTIPNVPLNSELEKISKITNKVKVNPRLSIRLGPFLHHGLFRSRWIIKDIPVNGQQNLAGLCRTSLSTELECETVELVRLEQSSQIRQPRKKGRKTRVNVQLLQSERN